MIILHTSQHTPRQSSLLSNSAVDQGVNISLTPLQLTADAPALVCGGVPVVQAAAADVQHEQEDRISLSCWCYATVRSRDRAELNLRHLWLYFFFFFFFFHTPLDHWTHLTPPPSPSLHVRIDVPVVIAERKHGEVSYERRCLRSWLSICTHLFANCFSFVLFFCSDFITFY